MSCKGSESRNGDWSMISENGLCKNFPVHRACRDGDVPTLTALLQRGDTLSHLTLEDTYYGWTPTHWAAYFGKLECLRVLIGSNAAVHPGMTTSRFTQTPAHIAAFAGHPHCLLWLLQTGVNPNAQDYLGETSLHKAARTGSTECVSILISNKVNTGIQNNNGQTAVQLAKACNYTELANYLLQVEGKQGGAESSCSIMRSVPSHGLNGGVFPHSAAMGLTATHKGSTPNIDLSPVSHANGNTFSSNNSPCTSSNGYYGFQPAKSPPNESLTGSGNVATKLGSEQFDDCDMDIDAAPVAQTHNGRDSSASTSVDPILANCMNGLQQPASQNGHANGHPNGFSAGTTFALTNGDMSKVVNHESDGAVLTTGNGSSANSTNVFKDITVNHGISQNFISIAGCKRSREEVYVPEMKRMRTDESLSPPPITSSLTKPTALTTYHHVRVPFCDITNGSHSPFSNCWEHKSLNYTPDEKPSKKMCKLETAHGNEMLMDDVEGEAKDALAEREETRELCEALLRATHGCESYLFFSCTLQELNSSTYLTPILQQCGVGRGNYGAHWWLSCC